MFQSLIVLWQNIYFITYILTDKIHLYKTNVNNNLARNNYIRYRFIFMHIYNI